MSPRGSGARYQAGGGFRTGWLALTAALLFVNASSVAAQAAGAPPSDNYDELFVRALEAARATNPGPVAPRPYFMAELAMDFRARHVNDIVTVQVIENVVASGSADSTLSKNSSALASTTKLFGLEQKLPSWLDPTSLVNAASDTSFKGAGVTTRKGVLSAVVSSRVAEVLPNGDLVVEGVREIDINGDRQIIVLTGIVRPADIGPSNVVLSTSVGQLRIRYFGRGLIKDNLKPGWLVRFLNKIF